MWTLSALLSQGDPNIMFAHAPPGTSLEERVAATLSAELAAVFSHQAQEAGAHAHLGLYDEPEPENEDDEDEEDASSVDADDNESFADVDDLEGTSPRFDSSA